MGRCDVVENVPGNFYNKYATNNRIARRLVDNFLRHFVELATRTESREAFEVGCGEGMLSLELLRRGWNLRGADLEDSVVQLANQASVAEGFGERFTTGDLYDLSPADAGAELVICCEVLEHVPDPERALTLLARCARPWVLVSVPREPIWRMLNLARGKYIAQLGNTPGHIQHWSQRSFVQMVGRHLDVVEVRAPLPWTMLLGRARDHATR